MEDKEKIICNIFAQALILLDFLDNNEEYHDFHNKKLKDYYIFFVCHFNKKRIPLLHNSVEIITAYNNEEF